PGWDRDRIMAAIADRGVPCFVGFCSEVYREKAFDGTGWRPEPGLPVTRALGETCLMFLVHPTLSEQDVDTTCAVPREVMMEAGGYRKCCFYMLLEYSQLVWRPDLCVL